MGRGQKDREKKRKSGNSAEWRWELREIQVMGRIKRKEREDSTGAGVHFPIITEMQINALEQTLPPICKGCQN